MGEEWEHEVRNAPDIAFYPNIIMISYTDEKPRDPAAFHLTDIYTSSSSISLTVCSFERGTQCPSRQISASAAVMVSISA